MLAYTVNSALLFTVQKTQASLGGIFGQYEEAKVCMNNIW